MQWLIAVLLVAHALVHAFFLVKAPVAAAGGPDYPFDLDGSWLMRRLGAPAPVGRWIGTVLIVVTIGAFVPAALVAVGMLGAGIWGVTIVVGALASLVMLVLFFSPWFLVGIAIDGVLLWAVLVAGWLPPK